MTDRAVLVEIFASFVGRQGVHHLGPDLLLLPAVEASVMRVPLAEARRKPAPRRAASRNPEHGFDEESIVASVAAGVALLSGEARSDQRPPLIREIVVHPSNLPRKAPRSPRAARATNYVRTMKLARVTIWFTAVIGIGNSIPPQNFQEVLQPCALCRRKSTNS